MKENNAALYEQYAEYVYRYLFTLTGDPDTAEELTQETFYQALCAMDSYRGEASAQVWLCAIAKRRWYKELERRKRTVSLEQTLSDTVAAADDPAGQVSEQEERRALYRAMQQLDPDTREVLHLRLTGEFSFRDIGEILGRSEVWTRVRFYRGKEELTKIMGGGADARE